MEATMILIRLTLFAMFGLVSGFCGLGADLVYSGALVF
jgi:hypothetical protein